MSKAGWASALLDLLVYISKSYAMPLTPHLTQTLMPHLFGLLGRYSFKLVQLLVGIICLSIESFVAAKLSQTALSLDELVFIVSLSLSTKLYKSQ